MDIRIQLLRRFSAATGAGICGSKYGKPEREPGERSEAACPSGLSPEATDCV